MLRNLEINFTSNKKIGKTTIHKIVSAIRKELEFNLTSLLINLVTSEEITKINKKYLKHNYSTDVITFDYSNNKKSLDGEIFISIDDAEYNSKKYDISLREEIMRLIIHGILHLMDYDDKKRQNRIIMKRKEDQLMRKLSIKSK